MYEEVQTMRKSFLIRSHRNITKPSGVGMSEEKARKCLSYSIAHDISKGMQMCMESMSKDILSQIKEGINSNR